MTKLIKYDAACRALGEAKRIDDVKAIKDKAEAMRAYAREINNPQLEADAWEIKKRAEDRYGELSLKLEKSRPIGKGQERPSGGTYKTDAIKATGVSKAAAHRFEQFHRLPAEEKERRIAKGRAAIQTGKSIADAIITQDDKRERRDERERELADKISALPDRRYGVIVADPEWRFEPWSRESGMDRSADNHYPTSLLEVIKSRPVADIAAENCLLGLWATIPMLEQALEVMAAWGFEYRSHYVWTKDKFGTGYWSREQHELFLIGIKGKVPAPAMGTQWSSVIEAPRGKHSEKPECFLKMIEQYFPTIPKIELNRRGPVRPGWDAWGAEAEAA